MSTLLSMSPIPPLPVSPQNFVVVVFFCRCLGLIRDGVLEMSIIIIVLLLLLLIIIITEVGPTSVTCGLMTLFAQI